MIRKVLFEPNSYDLFLILVGLGDEIDRVDLPHDGQMELYVPELESVTVPQLGLRDRLQRQVHDPY
jgi:hypothetical protein